MSYADAISYTQSQLRPESMSCLQNPDSYYHYVQEPGSSIVLEVSITLFMELNIFNDNKLKRLFPFRPFFFPFSLFYSSFSSSFAPPPSGI